MDTACIEIHLLQNAQFNYTFEKIIENIDYYLSCGTILDNKLVIKNQDAHININLPLLIKNLIISNNKPIIDLIIEKKNINMIMPDIMLVCVKYNTNLFLELMEKQINISQDDYACMQYLAYNGNLEIIKYIMNKYEFNNAATIVSKMCAQAIKNNQINILNYFFTKEVFIGAPDQIFTYITLAIARECSIDVVIFFIEGGVNIKQNNYLLLDIAASHKRLHILKYFSLNEKVHNILVDRGYINNL